MDSRENNVMTGRWTALDLLRGLTIAAMILVNRPGDWSNLYAPLAHAEWHGATPTDFIFPFFLFIVGVSIAIAFHKQREKGVTPAQLYPKILIRALKLMLFGLGMGLLIYLARWSDFRATGVLQRIAIVYLLCSLLFLHSGWRTQLLFMAVILVGYWLLLSFVPVPGTGSTGFAWEDNLVSWFDRQYMPGALYRKVHDPEGLLSTIPAIATGLSGLLTGHIYLHYKEKTQLLRPFALIGLAGVLLGWLWNLDFPFNKNLWSSSYVLYTSGWALLFLAGITWLVDIKKWQWGVRPLLVFGSNAITVYLLSFLMVFPFALITIGEGTSLQSWLLGFVRQLPLNLKQVSLAWALFSLVLCYIPMDYLFRKKIFLKI
jgi:predicted acyltransferase